MKRDIRMDLPLQYRIQVAGAIDKTWFDYYDNMYLESVTEEEGKRPLTTLTGQVTDQAALMGMLNLLYDMQLPLLSVECLVK
jgi:hypothetical protein